MEEVDRCPRGELLLDPFFLLQLLKHPIDSFAEALLEAAAILGLDLLVVDAGIEAAARTISRLRSQSDLFIFGVVNGPFGAASAILGLQRALIDIHQGRKQALELLGKQAGINCAAAIRCLMHGADGIIIADDLAYSVSTFLDPAQLREKIFPHLKEMAKGIKSEGKPLLFHSDGCYDALIPDLAEMGFDGIHCIDPSSGMTYEALRHGAAADLCLMGDIDASLILGNYSPEVVRGMVARSHASLSDRRGYIFGTCCGIPAEARAELVRAVYHAAREIEGS